MGFDGIFRRRIWKCHKITIELRFYSKNQEDIIVGDNEKVGFIDGTEYTKGLIQDEILKLKSETNSNEALQAYEKVLQFIEKSF